MTRLSVIRQSLRPEVNKWSGAEGRSFWVEGWAGDVYCAEVPNNTLYVRRNGKPVWSGNSVLEHANFTVLCTGVSRALTHELIRHRHLSYSEQSQRYVEIPPRFVVPPLLPDAAVDAWEKDQEAAYARYLFWRNAGLAQGMARKDAFDLARYNLPEGTETRIYVTGNIRAWRGCLDQRGKDGAAAEIHRLALAVFEKLRTHSTTWADYVDTDGNLITPTPKV